MSNIPRVWIRKGGWACNICVNTEVSLFTSPNLLIIYFLFTNLYIYTYIYDGVMLKIEMWEFQSDKIKDYKH